MPQLNPYLSFAGNCEEAINFYKDCLDGEILSINYYEGSPMKVPEGFGKKIMHASLKIWDNILMASDISPEHPVSFGDNISLSIGLSDPEKTEKYFKNLSAGGKVIMGLQDTFWGARFGMLKDKFGINWMLNCELKK